MYILGGALFTWWTSYLLNGLSKLTVIQKRYSSITRIVIFLSLFLIIIVKLLYCALVVFTPIYSDIFEIILSIFDVICFHGIIYLIFLRFWLMYFDVKYTISELDKEWIVFLDPNKTKTNWYFTNINKYGNIKWLISRLSIIYAISISISITINILILYQPPIIPYYCDIINIISHIIPISINIYIYSKTPTFYDHYYMRDEMKAINIVFIIYLSIQIIHYILLLILTPSYIENIWLIQIIYIIVEITLIGSLCFVCTGWIVSIISSEYGSYSEAKNSKYDDNDNGHPAKFRFIYISQQPSYNPRNNNQTNNIPSNSHHNNNNHNNNNNINVDDDGIRIPVLIHRTNKHLEDIKISKKLKLPQILSANESFTLFMQHLSRESSSQMACLLSFVEYVQFKQLLKDNLTDIQSETFGNAKLAPSIPKSIIVHTSYDNDNNDLLKEYKCRAYMLYNKYIKRDAELELRLPEDYKKALDEKMDELDKLVNSDINENQLFHIFDDVICSQYHIMWKSYQRFVNTNDYQLVENLFNNQQQQEKK